MSFCRGLLLLLLFAICAPVFAQLSPGDLSTFHEKLEGLNNCTQCHELRKDVSPALCLTCHTAIDARIKAGTGYHSSDEVKASTCAKCHAEHYGRDFELVFWKEGKEAFDHAKTGWELAGAHTRAGCRQCHTAALITADDVRTADNLTLERTYLGLGTSCLDCHVEEHQGQFAGRNCLECHSQDAWKPARNFSHDKTDYPLTGKHFDLECAKCHAAEIIPASYPEGKIVKAENSGMYLKYSGLEFRNCAPCHRDVHENKFGADCASCHNTSGFSQIAAAKFDHNSTGFPLVGKHIGLDCAKCHTSGKTTDPVAHAACRDCHQDVHRGQFAARADGGACESCHTVEGFLPALYTLDDHQQSDYPLTGSHLAVPCFLCHTQVPDNQGTTYARFEFASSRCKDCHADVHRGQLDKYINEGGCEFCHNTTTWHQVSFDHGKTNFPLIGRHESAACMGCHTIENPGTDLELIRMSPLAKECAMCHRDPHAGQFLREGNEVTLCKTCHTPSSWRELAFDHNRDARWALDGAHQKVACNLCHLPDTAEDGTVVTRYRPLGMVCADCHAGAVNNKQ